MKIYKVCYSEFVPVHYIEVEAEDELKAYDKAKEVLADSLDEEPEFWGVEEVKQKDKNEKTHFRHFAIILINWRFERKWFRAEIETRAAKTRRSGIIFLLTSVGEEFVVFHLLHFYTVDRSLHEDSILLGVSGSSSGRLEDVTFARSGRNFDHRTSWTLDESKQETIPVLENTC